MAKQKKKRTKKYTGQDAAATSRPTITRVEAVHRSRLNQWWFDRKRILKPILIAAIVIIVVVWLLIEFIRIIAGS